MIRQINMETYDSKTLTDKSDVTSSLHKIRVSEDGKIVAVAGEKKIFIFTNLQSNEDRIQLTAPQSFDSVLETVAVSYFGGHVFYVKETGKGTDLGACPREKYQK